MFRQRFHLKGPCKCLILFVQTADLQIALFLRLSLNMIEATIPTTKITATQIVTVFARNSP